MLRDVQGFQTLLLHLDGAVRSRQHILYIIIYTLSFYYICQLPINILIYCMMFQYYTILGKQMVAMVLFELGKPLPQWHGHGDPNPVECWEQHPWSRVAKGNMASKCQHSPHMTLVEARNLTSLEWVGLFPVAIPNLGRLCCQNGFIFIWNHAEQMKLYKTKWIDPNIIYIQGPMLWYTQSHSKFTKERWLLSSVSWAASRLAFASSSNLSDVGVSFYK